MKLNDLVVYLDRYLDIRAFNDRSNNGLQVEGRADVHRVAFAVDASLEVFQKAAEANADLLLVHHGMFWSEPLMVVGPQRRRLQALFAAGLSLYGAHLPLDAHPEVGNNVEMARLLGLRPDGEFASSYGRPVGLLATVEEGVAIEELRRRLSKALGNEANCWPFRERARRIALLTGSAASALTEAIATGAEALVCGELVHMGYFAAKEAGLGVVLGGHYLTETLGLKALAAHLAHAHGLETIWVEVPTGL